MPGRSNGWWISPAIPTIANAVLAVLWGFSALGGWGDAAFCGDADQHDPGCGDDFGFTVRLSVPFAVLAAVIGVAAWALPRVRHNPARLDALLTVGAFLWVLAEGVLFIGGYIAKP
ncbi:hypothetical protein J4573_47335 [Actinomadura barringtoniae]|uniref:DUF998 domain-containing protein n=1 Tax=Actinomadura barringtoniae TaxID=1427535 RepID=A0A939PTH4_9ACTN|nr:hypothetical protein [Actinomadura barringtoniae]MBO2454774.1 hypothetical protein [Actinomadura barringtoniae]